MAVRYYSIASHISSIKRLPYKEYIVCADDRKREIYATFIDFHR